LPVIKIVVARAGGRAAIVVAPRVSVSPR